MAVQQQELVGIDLPANLRHRQQAAHPAFAQPRRTSARTAPLLDLRDERFTVRMVDAHDRRRRLAPDRFGRRRAPDRGADAFVNVLARVDVDLGDGAAALERLHRTGHRESFGEHDAALDRIRALIAGARGVRRVEQRRRAGGVARRHVADLALNRLIARRTRHRRRPRTDRSLSARAVERQLRAFGKADVQLRRVQRDRDPHRAQPIDDVVAGLFFRRGPRFPHQGDERVEQRLRLVEPDGVARRRLEGFICVDVERL